jgi:hypothetical protein
VYILDWIDPTDIFTNGTLNVVTGFAFGRQYNLDDPDFKLLQKGVKIAFEYLEVDYSCRVFTTMIPQFLFRFRCIRKWVLGMFPGSARALLAYARYIFPVGFRQIKVHRSTVDFENPKDYLGERLCPFINI